MDKLYFKIHREGFVYVILFCILTIIFLPFITIVAIIFAILTFFIIIFFRDPKRCVPIDDLIVSPADGVITYIGQSTPPKECGINEKFIKISIFLNIINVHVNRVPTYGKVKKIKYVNGKFINATLNKSSQDNERNIITIEKDNKDIVVVSQIAGLIARRIVCNLKINQKIIKGDRFGIIRFGSRVDLYLPNNYTVLVSVGQSVIGGETIISNPNNISQINKTLKI